jgi:alkanesulfonate monooxygenase SsuD/methylene tetrahydromethanopterin reductase-like flavin-dependent oxidoreductase (luciferase family)
MRTGLFCTFENPQKNYAAAFADQIQLIQHVEAQGYDDIFVAEHHFNSDSASPSSLALLSYIAAKTSRLRLGTAAVLLPLRNPIEVAEDVATLDLLSDGRFDFGVGKGGPFPMQLKHFGLHAADAGPKSLEALGLIERLLSEDSVNFRGQYFSANDLSLVPKPLQNPVPIFIASSTQSTIRVAAEKGHGLMAGPPFPLVEVRRMIETYRATEGASDPKLVLIRFFHVAANHAEAINEAKQLLAPFAQRMAKTVVSLQPTWSDWFDLDRVIADSLIGTPDEIGRKITQIEQDFKPRSLILKPFAPDLAKRQADLDLFAAKLRPRSKLAA